MAARPLGHPSRQGVAGRLPRLDPSLIGQHPAAPFRPIWALLLPAVANHNGVVMTTEPIREDGSPPGAAKEGCLWARRPLARVGRGRSFVRDRHRDDHPRLPYSIGTALAPTCSLRASSCSSLRPSTCGVSSASGPAGPPERSGDWPLGWSVSKTTGNTWSTTGISGGGCKPRRLRSIGAWPKRSSASKDRTFQEGRRAWPSSSPPTPPIAAGGEYPTPTSSPRVQRPRPRHQMRRPADNQPALFDQDDERWS